MKPTLLASFTAGSFVGQHLLQVQAGDDLGALAQAEELGPLLGAAGGDDDDAVLDRGALAVGLHDDAVEVADEALEVGEMRLQVDLHVRVVDEALLAAP